MKISKEKACVQWISKRGATVKNLREGMETFQIPWHKENAIRSALGIGEGATCLISSAPKKQLPAPSPWDELDKLEVRPAITTKAPVLNLIGV